MFRLKAKNYYTEALSGATPQLKNKIDYQLARLMRMQGENMKALTAFARLTETKDVGQEILRESMLSIAEIQDEEGQWTFPILGGTPRCPGAERHCPTRKQGGDRSKARHQVVQASLSHLHD